MKGMKMGGGSKPAKSTTSAAPKPTKHLHSMQTKAAPMQTMAIPMPKMHASMTGGGKKKGGM